MPGYTENSIVVLRDFDTVFDLTNRIELWTKLFTEYEEATVLAREGNTITFRLKTFPDEGRPARSWVSTRTVDRARRCADAERQVPAFPFQTMRIHWTYEPLPKDVGVVLTWMQTFEIHPDCPISTELMESHLNRNTRVQMRAVKNRVETWPEGATP